jgi:hypothetical protein
MNFNFKNRKEEKNSKFQKGIVLTGTLIFSMIAISIIIALTSWFAIVFKSSADLLYKEQAFHIAESGIEYYRWHLAHDPDDFFDGTGAAAGEYIHDFTDTSSTTIGRFSLKITPPNVFSNFVIVESTGFVLEKPELKKTIRVKFAKPSFAKFAFVADANLRFGTGTEVFGPIHSNGGIRFDGIAHNLITSARATYDDPDHDGAEEFGVHTHSLTVDPLPPAEVPVRTDIFKAGRQFPVPAVDFSGLTNDLSELKDLAVADGKYFNESGALGYKIVLKENDTFDLYKVTSLANVPSSSCQNSSGQDGWGTWSIATDLFQQNYSLPNNGVIFAEDNVWVEGKINGARVTIAAGKFPDLSSTRKSIIVNNDLFYTNYDGSDSIALIAQKDITTGLVSDTDLRIDAALIAQNGRIGRFYYGSACSPNQNKNSITLYGMLASKNRYGFAYTSGGVHSSGYTNRIINYDANLLYNPPPHFPLTSDNYEMISWEEVI